MNEILIKEQKFEIINKISLPSKNKSNPSTERVNIQFKNQLEALNDKKF
jgi:hypothetical protein